MQNTHTIYTKEIVKKFAARKNLDTTFLAYRDLPEILKKYAIGNLALDFGCGTGFSTQLLYKEGYKVIGCDINENMIKVAKIKFPKIEFININNSTLKLNFFDVILHAFVFLEMKSLNDILISLKEIKSLLKKDGIFIIITASEQFPLHNWLTAQNTIDKNHNLRSGDLYRLFDTKNQMIFSDFHYSNEDCIKVLNQAGFNILESIFPLGKESDNIPWTTEWTVPPYAIYVCS